MLFSFLEPYIISLLLFTLKILFFIVFFLLLSTLTFFAGIKIVATLCSKGTLSEVYIRHIKTNIKRGLTVLRI